MYTLYYRINYLRGMIKTSELRIGNWLQLSFGKPVQVTEIEYEIVGYGNYFYPKYGSEENQKTLTSHGLPYTDINPIPLTPEILEKCGFRNDHGNGNLWWEHPDTNDFGLLEGEEEEDYSFLFEHRRLTMDIKHLHQLQNLYFALTGEEIQYTP